jgi:hypothetical protein
MRRIVALSLLIGLSSATVVEASILNLSGSLEVSYSWSRDEQDNKVTKKISDLQQRYNLRNFGDLLDPRLGTFAINGTFLHDDLETRGDAVGNQKQYNNLRLMDYSASVNLMPRLAPLTVTVQRITQYNGSGSCYFFCSSGENTQKDRATNYNLNWIIPIDRLPTVRMNLYQTNLKSNNGLFAAAPTDITTKFADLEVSDRFKNFNVVTRYQFSQTEFEGRDTLKSNAVNLNLDGRITPALYLTASGNYTTDQGGLNTAGIGFIQERGGRFALFYRPSSLWDGSISYDLSENPSNNVEFKRHLAQGSLNLRPTTQLDIFTSYRFMRLNTGPSLTDSHFGTAGFNWHPASLFGLTNFGLLTGGAITYGQTDVSGTGTASPVSTTFQNYRYSISYSRGLDRYRLNTGYSISYGVNRTTSSAASVSGTSTGGNTITTLNDTNQSFTANQFVNFHVAITGGTGAGQVSTITSNSATQLTVSPPWTTIPDNSSTYLISLPAANQRDLLNSFNVALENTDVRLIHWLVSYAFSDIHRNGETVQPEDDQRSHVMQVSVDSSYFRDLFLQATASYTNVEGFGTQGRTIQGDLRATYYVWQGLSIAAEVNHQDFPGGFFGDSDIFSGEAQWVKTLVQRVSLLFNVKEIYQLNQSTDDRQTFQGHSQLIYQFGKFLLTMDYLFVKDEGIHTAASLDSQNFFVRAIRTF